ncbi:MAG: hypothetical protein KAJ19_06070 [Gammaproteobacteria bacterium]|nr:hypothetical protein [Gammaproteobacteria bacterium]
MSMGSGESDSNDGSDIFWPGYVDATTNLILNLLFLVTILIVAVFMFALELGRTSKVKVENPPIVATKPAEEVLSKVIIDPVEENIVLKREVERLKIMLGQRGSEKVKAGVIVKSIDATSTMPKPQSGVDKMLASDFEIIVHFKDEAIALTPAEHEKLLETLKPVVESGKTNIHVEVPAGFSEAKRMGFYRAMAIRNLLIEMKMSTENIDVSVIEGKSNANASLVKIRSRK